MSDSACPSCGAATEHWKPPTLAEVPMPFWARLDLAQTLCPCGAQLRVARPSYAPAEPYLWTRDNEMLKPFVDYRLTSTLGSTRAQRRPTCLFWAWTPLRHSDRPLTRRGRLDLP